MNTRSKNKKFYRTRQIKRRVLLFFTSIILVAVISFVFFGTQAKAESKDAIHIYKYYKSVNVMPNDSLWDYAKTYAPDNDYNKYIEEVSRMNNLHDYQINEGMNIIIPYYSSDFIE